LLFPFHNGKTSLFSITLTERTTNQKPKAKRKNEYPILGLHRMLLVPVNFLVAPSQVQICIIKKNFFFKKKKKEKSFQHSLGKQTATLIMGNRENKTNPIDAGSAAKQWRGERSTHRSQFPGCMIDPKREREREELKGKARACEKRERV
jgi:hypothetical protein